MKDKIFAALKSMYNSKYSVSDKFLTGLAATLAINVTEESQIQAAISHEGVVEALAGAQAYGDSRAEAAKKPDPAKPDPTKPAPTPEPEKPGDAAPAWFTEHTAQMKTVIENLTKELGTIKAEKAVDIRKATLEAKLDKVPDSVKTTILNSFKYMNFADDAAFDAYLTELQPQIDATVQEVKETAIEGTAKPIYGAAKTGGDDFKTLMSSVSKAAEAKTAATA